MTGVDAARPSCVAVTGAQGKLGRSVVAELLDHGFAVVAIDRAEATDASARASLRTVDLSNAEAADTALDGCDVLIHLAAITDPVSFPALHP